MDQAGDVVFDRLSEPSLRNVQERSKPNAPGWCAESPARGAMNEITRILSVMEQGEPLAAADLLPLVYDELRKLAVHKLAREAPGQTLQATALVHEAYVRLVDVERTQAWASRGHFFAAA